MAEDCNILQTGPINSTIHCNEEYDCCNRQDEDPYFCAAFKANESLTNIEELNTAYDR